jgi:CheY-like chemotaxis protein
MGSAVMPIFCDVCSKKMRASGSYPAIASISVSDRERRVALCSPVCLLRLLWIVGLPPDTLILEPLGEDGLTARPLPPPARPSSVRTGPPPCCWIMVIEDDEATREAITFGLEDTGYGVVAVPDGLEALSFLKTSSSQPAVIVLDLLMPVMDGMTFRRHQMQDPKLAGIPVVVVTAGAVPASGLHGAEVVRKPVELGRLLSAVAARCPQPPPVGLAPS